MKYPFSYILSKKFNDRQWLLEEEKFENLKILDGGNPITLAEIELADKELESLEYLDKRQQEYPTSEEKLEALWNHIVFNYSAPMEELKQKINSINDKYPAPSNLVMEKK